MDTLKDIDLKPIEPIEIDLKEFEDIKLTGFDNIELIGFEDIKLTGFDNIELIGFEDIKLTGFNKTLMLLVMINNFFIDGIQEHIKKVFKNSLKITKNH